MFLYYIVIYRNSQVYVVGTKLPSLKLRCPTEEKGGG